MSERKYGKMVVFSEHEKHLMSDCILKALEGCYQAQKLIADRKSIDAIRDYIGELQRLNTKICESMKGE